MPELPEVETIRKIIEPQIVGKAICSVKINNSQIIAYPDEEQFVKMLVGQEIISVGRRGKFLTIYMKSGDSVVIHLRMTGQLLVKAQNYPFEKHTHLIADLSGGNQIRYIDVRRFGRLWLMKKGEIDNVTGQEKLGLEPLSKDLNAEYLKTKLKKRKKSIKEMLNAQSVIAGIGNIYSDEILFASGIYPEVKCCDLSDENWNCLVEKIKEIIKWGIDTNKMTPQEYLAGKGKEYGNMLAVKVYGRKGQPCCNCQNKIDKIMIGGRSSYYCPKCQKEK